MIEKRAGAKKMEQLLRAIQTFKAWANMTFPGRMPYEIGGEWETEYNAWDTIVTAFEKVIKNSKPSEYTDSQLAELVYIIARDNECETLAEFLSDDDEWFVKICELTLQSQEPDAKWQLAIRLKEVKDKKQAGFLLEKFVQDDNEYVNRRALMELPELLPEKVEAYSKQFWHRNLYGPIQEYQRMAVLTALKKVNSPLLEEYLIKADEDGRKYLVLHAEKIRSEIDNETLQNQTIP